MLGSFVCKESTLFQTVHAHARQLVVVRFLNLIYVKVIDVSLRHNGARGLALSTNLAILAGWKCNYAIYSDWVVTTLCTKFQQRNCCIRHEESGMHLNFRKSAANYRVMINSTRSLKFCHSSFVKQNPAALQFCKHFCVESATKAPDMTSSNKQ